MAEFDQQEAIAIDPGLTALVVIARFHHISADANQLRHNSGIKSTAFGEHDLLLAARSLGLKTRKVPVSLGRFPVTARAI